ncbi:hypothetical protein [Actinoplanes sp. URMC 104]|uniref:hypothetical protein n=1 Tax=Actinoplanes sp. URMC 104 TaxID=3423409 RepID=UPI003F1BD95D
MTTAARILDDIAATIRELDDPEDGLSAVELGELLSHHLPAYGLERHRKPEVAPFVARTNPDKRVGAGHLAELIVAEFDLDKEH